MLVWDSLRAMNAVSPASYMPEMAGSGPVKPVPVSMGDDAAALEFALGSSAFPARRETLTSPPSTATPASSAETPDHSIVPYRSVTGASITGGEPSTSQAPSASPPSSAGPSSSDKPADDGYNWRKYGQKQVKGTMTPRSYYKCTHPNCPVKKQVERTAAGVFVGCTYKGVHTHPSPRHRNTFPVAPQETTQMNPFLHLFNNLGGVEVNTMSQSALPAATFPPNIDFSGLWQGMPVGGDHNMVAAQAAAAANRALAMASLTQGGAQGSTSHDLLQAAGLRDSFQFYGGAQDDMQRAVSQAQAQARAVVQQQMDGSLLNRLRPNASHVMPPLVTMDEADRGKTRLDMASGRPQEVSDDMANAMILQQQFQQQQQLANLLPAAKLPGEPRVVQRIECAGDTYDDGFRWRKYGQKLVKGTNHPRNYYKCTSPNCPVRKNVERDSKDPNFLLITYDGSHNHTAQSAQHAREISNAILSSPGMSMPESMGAGGSGLQQGSPLFFPGSGPSGSSAMPTDLALGSAFNVEEMKRMSMEQVLQSFQQRQQQQSNLRQYMQSHGATDNFQLPENLAAHQAQNQQQLLFQNLQQHVQQQQQAGMGGLSLASRMGAAASGARMGNSLAGSNAPGNRIGSDLMLDYGLSQNFS